VELRVGGLGLNGATVPGDRVTPLASAVPIAGLPVHELHFPHAFLLFEPLGLRQVGAA
jgi:hypothetical protein